MTPATEAGRRLLEDVAPIKTQGLGAENDIEWKVRQAFTDNILAIEDEARATPPKPWEVEAMHAYVSTWDEPEPQDDYQRGRADALREAAERVRALVSPKRYENDVNGNWFTTDMEYGWDCGVAAALAILDLQP